MTEPDAPEFVHKLAAYVPVSIEVLIDAGAITEEEARARLDAGARTFSPGAAPTSAVLVVESPALGGGDARR